MQSVTSRTLSYVPLTLDQLADTCATRVHTDTEDESSCSIKMPSYISPRQMVGVTSLDCFWERDRGRGDSLQSACTGQAIPRAEKIV